MPKTSDKSKDEPIEVKPIEPTPMANDTSHMKKYKAHTFIVSYSQLSKEQLENEFPLDTLKAIDRNDPLKQLVHENATYYEMFLRWFSMRAGRNRASTYCREYRHSLDYVYATKYRFAWEYREELAKQMLLARVKQEAEKYGESLLLEQKKIREELCAGVVGIAKANIARLAKKMQKDADMTLSVKETVSLAKLGIEQQREETLPEYKPTKQVANLTQTNIIQNQQNISLPMDMSALE